MQKKPTHETGFLIPRIALAFLLLLTGSFLAILGFASEVSPSHAVDNARSTGAAAEAAKPAAQQALDALRSGRSTEIAAQISRHTGYYEFVRASGGGILAPASASTSATSRAVDFLSAHGSLVGLNDADRTALRNTGAPADGSGLKAVKTDTDSVGFSHVRFDQFYKGVKVFGAQLIVHMNDNGITAVNGDFIPDISLSTVPTLSLQKQPSPRRSKRSMPCEVGGARKSPLRSRVTQVIMNLCGPLEEAFLLLPARRRPRLRGLWTFFRLTAASSG
jgi:hypothetical protein